MKGEINLNGKVLRKENKDFYFIAEIGTNYVEIAKKEHTSEFITAASMITRAHDAGANAVKFQIYEPEGLADEEKASSQFEYLKNHSLLSYEDYDDLIKKCEILGIDFIASLFTERAMEYFAPKLKILKIASPDITNKPMLQKLGKFNKPTILSTAGSTLYEIEKALDWIGHDQVAILHCTANYPTKTEDANLSVIETLNTYFSNIIGYSDHLNPENILNSPLYSFLLGARIIEKHFTIYRFLEGNDHHHSLTPTSLHANIERLREAQTLLGNPKKRPAESEADFVLMGRRSLAVNREMQKDEIITINDLISLRPATGIPPHEIDTIIGKKTTRKIDKNKIIVYNDII
jgi:N-acetylneuraminate synthase